MFDILQEYQNRPRIRKNMLRCIFQSGRNAFAQLAPSTTTIQLNYELIFCRKDKLRTEEANAQLRFSRVPKCTQLFSPLKKYRKREHGVANVESKTKCIFQAWQNACGQRWDIHVDPSFGLGKGCSDPWQLQKEA